MDKSPEAFRTISEVAEALDVPAHVLRFWETRFTQVKPVKRGGGRRYYRPEDVRLLRGIRGLLYDDGMTIKGVQKILRERGLRHVIGLGTLPAELELAPVAAPVVAPSPSADRAGAGGVRQAAARPVRRRHRGRGGRRDGGDDGVGGAAGRSAVDKARSARSGGRAPGAARGDDRGAAPVVSGALAARLAFRFGRRASAGRPAIEVVLEVLLQADEVVGKRQAERLHLAEPLAQGLLQLVGVGGLRAISSISMASCKPEFLERHRNLPVPDPPPTCDTSTGPGRRLGLEQLGGALRARRFSDRSAEGKEQCRSRPCSSRSGPPRTMPRSTGR